MGKIIYNSEAVIGDIKSERGKDETDIKIFEGVQKRNASVLRYLAAGSIL